MKITLKIVIFIFVFSSIVTHAQIDTTSINTLFYDYADKENPGAVVTIVKDNKVLLTKGYGSANLEYDIPLTATTPFNIASLTKQFVCFSILLLQEEGKLAVHDDIRKHIPELQKFDHTITIQHLMSHTSGLNDQWHLLSLAGWKLDDVITHSMVLDLLYKQHTLGFLPGEKYLYSNSNYTILAEIITRVSGTPFDQFLKDRIFNPLEMNNSFIDMDYKKVVKNKAYSYQKNTNGYVKSIFSTDTYGPRGIITTGEDMAKWMCNFHNIKVGSNEIINQLDEPQKLNNGLEFGGAYGQFLSSYKDRNIIQHTGSEAGYRSYLVRFPKEKLSIAVFSNRNNSNTKKLALQVADHFLKSNNEKPLVYKEKYKTEKIIPYPLKESDLRSFEGKYWNYDRGNSRSIRLQNDTLRYIINKNRQIPLIPIGENKFVMFGLQDYNEVTFRVDDTSSIKLDISSNEITDTLHGYTNSSYSKSELSSFVGQYYSEELNTFLTISVDDDILELLHQRQEDIILTPVMKDFFISDTWYIKSIKFLRNKGNVSGLQISSNRMRQVVFQKIIL
ncbi:serine hydrolase domain-containing protein [Aquimarina litoralis]|uniref:serine hydrolase domain-containing protein n=1 Tax=Aquimarina litoralis TaxID=584605 RepID=UPI001C55FB91|nr:serine hydrolase domain-containing protein [Aquimarina litoralis]MBW1298193.1 serine hydrolase [Aquimarina litoralis]